MAGRAAGLVAVAVAVVGCSALAPSALERAGREARVYPFVEVSYYHDEGFFPEESFLEVTVADGTTSEQARTLWCEIIAPHGGDAGNAIVATMDGDEYPAPDCDQ